MGCRVLPYWIGTFAFDYCLMVITIVIFLMFSAIFQITVITHFIGVWIYILFRHTSNLHRFVIIISQNIKLIEFFGNFSEFFGNVKNS